MSDLLWIEVSRLDSAVFARVHGILVQLAELIEQLSFSFGFTVLLARVDYEKFEVRLVAGVDLPMLIVLILIYFNVILLIIDVILNLKEEPISGNFLRKLTIFSLTNFLFVLGLCAPSVLIPD